MKRLWLSLGCMLALAGVGGCDGGGGGVDAGQDSGPGEPELPVLMAWDDDAEELVAADFSCLGTEPGPTAGAEAEIEVRTMARALMDAARPDTTVHIYPANQIPAGLECGDGCTSITTGTDGTTTVSLPAGGWFAYRVPSVGTTATTLQFNTFANPDSRVDLSVISRSLFEGALGAASVTVQEDTASFTGTFTDCSGNTVMGAQVRLVGPSGVIQGGTAPTGPRIVYWNATGPFPSPTRTFTSEVGRYAGGNIPPAGRVRLELWGVRTEGGDPELVACEQFDAHGDQVSIIAVGPLRSDAPAGCGS
jgi:hypothetical protein